MAGHFTPRVALISLGALFLSVGCAAVEQTGGNIIPRPDLEENRNVLSPPILGEPLLDCATAVIVYGYVPEARIDVFADGTFVDGTLVTEGTLIGSKIGEDPDSEAVPVSPDLATDQEIYARQTVDGITSGPSEPVVVLDIDIAYPFGLPRPEFPFLELFDCGTATYVGHLPPGGQVRVFAGPPGSTSPPTVSSASGVKEGQSLFVNPQFVDGHDVYAESEICGRVSDPSRVHRVQPPPAVIPAPDVHPAWDEGKWLSVSSLVNGARVRIQNLTTGDSIGGGSAPAGHVKFRVSPPVADGDDIEAIQELCGVDSPPGTTTVGACDELPPALLRAPSAGDTKVFLLNVVPGARIQIYASGQKIGDGGGSTIALTRPLADGEEVLVVQILGSCVAATVHRVEVGLALEDPADPGLCSRVLSFEYGTSSDPDARTTDLSTYFNTPALGVTTPMDAVPLHGIVRYPDGPGPYPLVLIVHGNHDPFEASEPGYDYLLDLLASHCMIAVSIDANFLNGRVLGEMDARGILLLRHLQLWREWTRTPGHQFFTKVDERRIGLAGHSRGGEAATVAQMFNGTLHDPMDPEHDFDFDIQGLYGIAPVDGQFQGGTVVVRGAHYFVMHGSHDGDVSPFSGYRTFDRAMPVTEAASRFKGLLFVYGANHGQWNTVWGTSSETPAQPVGERIGGTEQRDIGKAYLAAFFLSSVKGWSEYNALFKEEATFPGSLPSSINRVTQYQDPHRVFVNHYEEDDNLATGSFTGVVNNESGPPDPYRDYPFDDNLDPYWFWEQTEGLVFGWSADDTELVVDVPSDLGMQAADYSHFAFRIGQVFESSSPTLNTVGAEQDLTIRVRFGGTFGPQLLVSDYATLFYPHEVDANGPNPDPPPAPQWIWRNMTKTVLQTVRIPWEDLLGPELRQESLADVSQIYFEFDQKSSGLVAIDEMQFTD